MVTLTLNHNSPESLIRRPSGLTDVEWDFLIEQSIMRFEKATGQEGNSFLRRFIEVVLESRETYKHIVKILSITNGIVEQEWEHVKYKFFRHFCPEDFRSALNHGGMPYASLETTILQGFLWFSTKWLTIIKQTPLLESFNIKLGARILIAASGKNDVEYIYINGQPYYIKTETGKFGDRMYELKRTIILNKERKKSN